MLPRPKIIEIPSSSRPNDTAGLMGCGDFTDSCSGGDFNCTSNYTCKPYSGLDCVDTSFLPCTWSLGIGGVVVVGAIVT